MKTTKEAYFVVKTVLEAIPREWTLIVANEDILAYIKTFS